MTMSDEGEKKGFLEGIMEGVAKKAPQASPNVIEAEKILETLDLSSEDKAMLAGRLLGSSFTELLGDVLNE